MYGEMMLKKINLMVFYTILFIIQLNYLNFYNFYNWNFMYSMLRVLNKYC